MTVMDVDAMNRSSIVTALAALILAQPALPDTDRLDRSTPIDAGASDPSTWRWYVSKVQDNQRRLPSQPPAIGASRFKVQP